MMIDEKIPRWKVRLISVDMFSHSFVTFQPEHVLIENGIQPVEMKQLERNDKSITFGIRATLRIVVDFVPLKVSVFEGSSLRMIMNNL